MKRLPPLFLALSLSQILVVDLLAQPAYSDVETQIKEVFSLARNGTRKQWDEFGVSDTTRIGDSWKYVRKADLARLIRDCDEKALASYHKSDLVTASDRLYVGLSCAAAFGKVMLAHQGSAIKVDSKQAPPLVWLAVFKALSASDYDLPKNSYILAVNNYAYYVRQEGQYKESIPIFEKIISLDPERIVTNLDLADALWETGEREEARHYYARYLTAMKKAKFKNVPPRVLERSGHRN